MRPGTPSCFPPASLAINFQSATFVLAGTTTTKTLYGNPRPSMSDAGIFSFSSVSDCSVTDVTGAFGRQ
jgi:hypothetical protein